MTKKKVALLVAGGVLLCLLVLREIGVVDASLYKSALSASQTAATSSNYSGEEKHFSYHLIVKRNSETLDSRFCSYNNLPPIDIEATLEEPVYTGNCALPLIKNFKMAYRCTFKTVKSSTSSHSVHGTINGEVDARIVGLCTRKKARALAFEEAKKQIMSYLEKQLNQ